MYETDNITAASLTIQDESLNLSEARLCHSSGG
jgi:hypothetical protein